MNINNLFNDILLVIEFFFGSLDRKAEKRKKFDIVSSPQLKCIDD